MNAAVNQKMQTSSNAIERGYWTTDDNKNLRKLLEDFAHQKGSDPSDPKTWYNTSREEFESYTEVRLIDNQYR